MIQDISPKKFDNQYKTVDIKPTDLVFCFTGFNRENSTVLIKHDGNNIIFPQVQEFSNWENKANCFQYLFSIDNTQFFLYMKNDKEDNPAGYAYESTRVLRLCEPIDMCFAGMTAFHLYVWYRESKFCGVCGHETIHDSRFRMKKCTACGHMIFPKIAPAVIIGLRNKDSIMISRYANRDYKGRALLAGFCEIGETPEETVAREVLEEVGLKVKNITYYGSQPWGFDSNLLLGYFADLAEEGQVVLDTEELASAGFVKREDIEYDPNLMSLTATMIEDFRTGKW